MRWIISIWLAGVFGVRAASLSHDVYIWQRVWDAPVVAAVSNAQMHVQQCDILAAEARWKDGRLDVTSICPDYTALRRTAMPVGLVLRVGEFPQNETHATATLLHLAVHLVHEALTNQIALAEVQVDFDCPENKLDVYRIWLGSLRRAIAPVPLTITALPCWLGHAEAFRRLVSETDGFVLQVHSLHRPSNAHEPFLICDPAQARRAVAVAGGFDRPFRIALPTYGYTLAFETNGFFTGFSAEGPALRWPEGTMLREVRSDPAAMAGLVCDWTVAPPAQCRGIIWYRLPCDNDQMNWSWVTLAAVMAGQTPRANLVISQQRPEPGLVELLMLNTGDADAHEPLALVIRWQSGHLLAADALGGFDKHADGTDGICFTGTPHLMPGQTRTIGWLRFRERQEKDLAIEIH